ncbi:MAG: hypothetical protein HDT24_06805, partial [Ruminococcus sp.]|nr:hypothetical protein [Ruminococcus sp.]
MKKLPLLAAVLAVALSLSACGENSAKNAETDIVAADTSEKTNETTTAKPEETTISEEKTTAEMTETEPVIEFVEPAAEDFEYQYDTVINGIKIT